MNLRIAGAGWITPIGRGVSTVWELLLSGMEAKAETISDASTGRSYSIFPVPAVTAKNLPPHPRLRRSSAISRFAAAAGLDAIENAKENGIDVDPKRLALVFAVSNGGVIYTKRFYQDIVDSGADGASPLLFPETVFNAPASHIAAILGITGPSYTLVSDGAVGVAALQMAGDLLLADATVDHCLVVAAEEADWLLCDAYHRWRLLRKQPPIAVFQDPPSGMILSEGAGAILVGRTGLTKIDAIAPGQPFIRRTEASQRLAAVLTAVDDGKADVVIASANGTFVDLAEQSALLALNRQLKMYAPKGALGESVGAGTMWQIIIAAQALRTSRLPPSLHQSDKAKLDNESAGSISSDSIIVLSCSLNHQSGGIRLSH